MTLYSPRQKMYFDRYLAPSIDWYYQKGVPPVIQWVNFIKCRRGDRCLLRQAFTGLHLYFSITDPYPVGFLFKFSIGIITFEFVKCLIRIPFSIFVNSFFKRFNWVEIYPNFFGNLSLYMNTEWKKWINK